jgi:cytochrome bd ubiquinol oxidase subunit II
MDLNITWFLLVGVLVIGYGILDGFDLGVGVLHLFTRDERDRRYNLNAIGPVWDGNEVWLLTGGGALFAAFPAVYATVFSGFYIALMLLLTALIFRAVSFEFRSKIDSPAWRTFWDWGFGLGSLVPALLFGVAFGNILNGVPIDAEGNYLGTFFGLLNPYAIIIGLVSLAAFTMHGAIYLTMKSEKDRQESLVKLIPKLWMAFTALYVIATFASILMHPYLFEGMMQNVIAWILFLLFLGSVVYIPVAVKAGKYFIGFIASSLVIACMTGLAAASLFPRLVPSSIDLAYSLTIYNASSTQPTLQTMLIIALIGMPFVIGYTAFIYNVFKGKVVLTKDSY